MKFGNDNQSEYIYGSIIIKLTSFIMICSNCGKTNENDSNFCKYCGDNLNQQQQIQIIQFLIGLTGVYQNQILILAI